MVVHEGEEETINTLAFFHGYRKVCDDIWVGAIRPQRVFGDSAGYQASDKLTMVESDNLVGVVERPMTELTAAPN